MNLNKNFGEYDLRDSRNDLQRIHSNKIIDIHLPYDMLNTDGVSNTHGISHCSSRT